MKKIYQKLINLIETNKSSGINLAILSFIALFIKQYCTYLTYKNLSYGFKYYLNSFCTDLMVVLIILCLTTINQFITNRKIKILNNIISFIIFAVFCIDIFTIYFLQNRVAVPEIFKFMSNGGSGFTHVVVYIVIVIIFLRILSLLFTTKIKKNSKNMRNIRLLVLLMLCGMAIVFSTPKEIDNILTINIRYIKQRYELRAFKQEILINSGNSEEKSISYEDFIGDIDGDGKPLNVILIFAESLSAIDSANMGGNNNMSGFDEIQNNGIKFTNFITNGVTSDTAHIATLLGIIPDINMGSNESAYSGYKLFMESLPEFLNKQGYKTTFLSTASLDFLDQRSFLSGVGFTKIIGEEEFEKNKTYTFDSAPDGDLYDRTLQEIESQTGKYFIGLQTISFHHPYSTPNGKDEKTALGYADNELYKFYDKLKNNGFFDSGILVILGDHRKMAPADSGEYQILGSNRYTRSVATIVGSGINSGTINSNIVQHTDFYNSLKKLLGQGNVKIDKTYNDIFSQHSNRDRGLTSAKYYSDKLYTLSYLDKTGYTFNNISYLKDKDSDLYEYLLSFKEYELGGDIIPELKNNNTILIGHQGSRNYFVENSLQGFYAAKEQGAKGIEFDVSYTKDKENIVAHGEYFYASNCSGYKINKHDFDRISKKCTLKNGEKYKKLKNMLEIIDGLFDYYFLEIKVYDESLGKQQTLDAIQTVKDLNMQDRVIFISYSDAAREVLSSDPDIIFGRDTFDITDLDFIGENSSKYFLVPYDLLTPEAIQKAKDLGKEVVTYTINDTGSFQMIKDLGVNIILTDEIELLKDYEENKKRNLVKNLGILHFPRF